MVVNTTTHTHALASTRTRFHSHTRTHASLVGTCHPDPPLGLGRKLHCARGTTVGQPLLLEVLVQVAHDGLWCGRLPPIDALFGLVCLAWLVVRVLCLHNTLTCRLSWGSSLPPFWLSPCCRLTAVQPYRTFTLKYFLHGGTACM